MALTSDDRCVYACATAVIGVGLAFITAEIWPWQVAQVIGFLFTVPLIVFIVRSISGTVKARKEERLDSVPADGPESR
ncbi:MAG TPA: hypothetical protein VF885_25195 [Arthrobacter sp.]